MFVSDNIHFCKKIIFNIFMVMFRHSQYSVKVTEQSCSNTEKVYSDLSLWLIFPQLNQSAFVASTGPHRQDAKSPVSNSTLYIHLECRSVVALPLLETNFAGEHISGSKNISDQQSNLQNKITNTWMHTHNKCSQRNTFRSYIRPKTKKQRPRVVQFK